MALLPFRNPPPLDPADVTAARRTLGFTPARLADVLAVPEAQVRDWERGVRRMPRRPAGVLRRMVEARERARRADRLERSSCRRADRMMDRFCQAETPAAAERWWWAHHRHAASCRRCTARAKPRSAWRRLSAVAEHGCRALDTRIRRLPGRMRPPARALLMLGGSLLVREVVLLPARFLDGDARLAETAIFLARYAVALVAGGTAYSLAGP